MKHLFKIDDQYEILWNIVIIMVITHIGAAYGLYIGMMHAQFWSIVFMFALFFLSLISIQCGVHRLWSHQSYKVKAPLEIFLVLCYSISPQMTIYRWCKDHKMHHLYIGTDGDPHNAERGFFFAHLGYLMTKKLPFFKENIKQLDMSYLTTNPIVSFHTQWYWSFFLVFAVLLPTYIPHYLWGESLWNAFFFCFLYRLWFVYHITLCLNSFSHIGFWGIKPYDKTLNAVECSLRHLAFGEGFHNFHHAFAWDYSNSEFGPIDVFNPATAFIDLMAKIGLAYDLKTASRKVVKARQLKKGDINHTKNSALYEYITGILSVSLLALPFILGFYLRSHYSFDNYSVLRETYSL